MNEIAGCLSKHLKSIRNYLSAFQRGSTIFAFLPAMFEHLCATFWYWRVLPSPGNTDVVVSLCGLDLLLSDWGWASLVCFCCSRTFFVKCRFKLFIHFVIEFFSFQLSFPVACVSWIEVHCWLNNFQVFFFLVSSLSF